MIRFTVPVWGEKVFAAYVTETDFRSSQGIFKMEVRFVEGRFDSPDNVETRRFATCRLLVPSGAKEVSLDKGSDLWFATNRLRDGDEFTGVLVES